MLSDSSGRILVIRFGQAFKRLHKILPFFIGDHTVGIDVQTSYYCCDFPLGRRPPVLPDKAEDVIDSKRPVPARIDAFEGFAAIPVRPPPQILFDHVNLLVVGYLHLEQPGHQTFDSRREAHAGWTVATAALRDNRAQDEVVTR